MSNAVIELDALSKWYGEVIGLNDVTVALAPGIVGLVGPNGAGKSTLMSLVMGQLRPSRGSIRVLGSDPWNNPRVSMRLGFCPEGDPFWPRLSGQEYVRFLARLSGLPRAEARTATERAIELTGMTEHCRRPVGSYSKGMRQRIKIAQALVHGPELLVLDEPMTGADPIARHDLVVLFKGLASEGVSILVSSHVLHEVEALTRNILMIDGGRIVAQGDLVDIRQGLDDRPHAVRIVLKKPRELAAILVQWGEILALRVSGESTLVVETRSPERVFETLPELALAHDLAVQEIGIEDESLEAVFQYLTEKNG